MEFWGVEVKAGESVKVDPQEFDAYIHLSQAALGETKKDKGAEHVVLYLKFGDQKLVLGTLSKDNFPQISFDLVLEKEFELSHNSKNGSVFYCGYKAELPDEEGDDFDDLSDSEEDVDLPADLSVIAKDNGKADAKTTLAKIAASKKSDASANDSKKQGKVDPKNEDDDSEDDESDEGGDSDEDMLDGESDSDDESDDEETPEKPDLSKKRSNDSALKIPVSAKKAKTGTPEKKDAKKGGHAATPHPMKKGGKTPNGDAKEPKSGGHLSCKPCSKTFNSGSGLQQHKKAKHRGQ